MSAVQCPHCEYVNTIDGAKPGQRVQCLACDAPFKFDPADAVPTFPTVDVPRTSAIAEARDAADEREYVELRKLNARLAHLEDKADAANARLKNLSQIAVFFAASTILWGAAVGICASAGSFAWLGVMALGVFVLSLIAAIAFG